jgi:L-threonylcarbamoyladenylate synthase
MDNELLARAVVLLNAGKPIIYPTDTLYAIGCDATNAEAVERIYGLKKRPRGMPLSVLVLDFKMLQKYAKVSGGQMRILKSKLPGQYTFILKPKIKLPVSDGNVGFRMIDVPITNEIVKKFGKPITATSANIHGEETVATITELKAVFKTHINLYMSGGTLNGKPSTVIDLTTNKILRD